MERLTIYFTSDTHGYLYNTNFASRSPLPMGLLQMQFPKDAQTLIIDGGDTLQGSPLTYYLHSKGLPETVHEALNARGYDYVTLGNHDFNYGYASIQGYLEALHATCLCANVEDLTGQMPIRPYTVHTMGDGLRVGLFGIVTDWINVWEKKENLEKLRVTSPMEAARACVQALKKEKVDLIIGIYHGGVEKDLTTGRPLSDTDENIACRLCEALDIDLLLTGHQHIAMAGKSWHGTHLVQTPCNSRQYVKVTWDGTAFTSVLCDVPSEGRWTEKEEALYRDVETWLDQPIGHLSRDLWPGDKLDMALHGTYVADFINQVQLRVSGADISCTSLANEMRGFAKDVTVRDVVASYVYSNTLVVREATGKIVREALEQCATYFAVDGDTIGIAEPFLRPKEAHFNYDYFAGLAVTYDLSCPPGKRVKSVLYRGHALQDDEKLTVCMNNYRASGAGDFPMWLQCPTVREIQTEVSELLLNELMRQEQVIVEGDHGITCLLHGKVLKDRGRHCCR